MYTSTETNWARRSRLAHNFDRFPARPMVRARVLVSHVVSLVAACRARIAARQVAVGPIRWLDRSAKSGA